MPDTGNYEVLAMTANYWAKGSNEASALHQLCAECGSSRIKEFGYVLYRVHPDCEIDPIHGDILTPVGHPPIKLLDRIVKKKVTA